MRAHQVKREFEKGGGVREWLTDRLDQVRTGVNKNPNCTMRRLDFSTTPSRQKESSVETLDIQPWNSSTAFVRILARVHHATITSRQLWTPRLGKD